MGENFSKIGTREVMTSGVLFLGTDERDVSIGFADMVAVVKFNQQRSPSDLHIAASLASDREMVLEIPYSPETEGFSWGPAAIGDYEDRKLYMGVYCEVLGTPDRHKLLVTYTVSREAA